MKRSAAGTGVGITPASPISAITWLNAFRFNSPLLGRTFLSGSRYGANSCRAVSSETFRDSAMIFCDLGAVLGVVHELVGGGETAHHPNQNVFVFLSPRAPRHIDVENKIRSRLVGKSEAGVTLFDCAQIFRWPIGTAAHSPDFRQLKRAPVPTTGLAWKSPRLMPLSASSLSVESVIVSPGVDKPSTFPLRSA